MGELFSLVFNGRERITTHNKDILLINLRRSFENLSPSANMLGVYGDWVFICPIFIPIIILMAMIVVMMSSSCRGFHLTKMQNMKNFRNAEAGFPLKNEMAVAHWRMLCCRPTTRFKIKITQCRYNSFDHYVEACLESRHESHENMRHESHEDMALRAPPSPVDS